MAIQLRWRYTPQVGAGDVTSLAAIVGPRGLGIASQSFNAETGVYTFTMTDGSTETVDFSGYTDSLEAIQAATEGLRDQAQGYATAAGAAAGFFDFKDLAALQDDETLTYTAGQDGSVVAGDIVRIRGDGRVYQVAPSASLDHDLESDGGVKLKRLLNLSIENTGNDTPAKLVNVTTTTLTIRPVGVFGGYLWGCDANNRLNRSDDFGITWALVSGNVGRSVNQAFPTADGEILVQSESGISKSLGWSSDPATATWTTVLSRPSGNVADFLKWGVDGDGQKFIATHYSSTRADSRYVWISTDAGSTFTIKYDSNLRDAVAGPLSHLHAACYDPWADRFYFTEGHGQPIVGIYYSDDDGETWVQMENDMDMDPAFTTMTATDFGIVCGTDGPPNGVFLIRRQDDPDDLGVEFYGSIDALTGRNGVVSFADHSFREPETGIVYVGFGSQFADVPHTLFACGASGASVVYEELDGGRIYSVFASAGNVLFQRGTGTTWMRGEASGLPDAPLMDRGNLGIGLGHFPPNDSLRVGKGSTAMGIASVAVGVSAVAGSVAAGNQRLTAVGAGALASGNGATSLGCDATATGTQSVSVGDMSSSVGAFTAALGYSASAGSTGGVAFGYDASAWQGIAIGRGASNVVSSNNGAISIGDSASATTDSVAIGRSAMGAVFGVTIGSGAAGTSTGAHAIGNAATAGNEAVAVGPSASASLQYSVAIGRSATAVHVDSVALGRNSATQRSNSVCVGQRHIESTLPGGRIYLQSPNGTKYYLTVDNDGNLSVTAG